MCLRDIASNLPLDNSDSFSDNSHAAIQDSYPVPEADSDDSMFEQSEASYNSMSTIRSDEVAGYFQSICGFSYQSDEGVPRLFPTNLSSEKLNVISHIIFRLLRGGTNVPPRVDEILRSGGVYGDQRVPRVLELATNTGVWVREMVDVYPSTVFVSIDTKPLVAHKPHARIKYEVYDFHAGVLEPDCSFDVVYTKHGATLTKDFNFLLREMHRVLKPNGFLLMDVIPIKVFEGVNADIPLFSAKHLAEGLRYVRGLWERQGVDIATWDDLPSRLDGSHPHWENSQSSETHLQSGATSLNRGFHTINLRVETLPLGTWSENERENIIGGLMRARIEIAWRNHLSNLVVEGQKESDARAFVEGVLEDLAAIDKFRAYHEFQLMCAQKI